MIVPSWGSTNLALKLFGAIQKYVSQSKKGITSLAQDAGLGKIQSSLLFSFSRFVCNIWSNNLSVK